MGRGPRAVLIFQQIDIHNKPAGATRGGYSARDRTILGCVNNDYRSFASVKS
jgi:hypothetical protein